jgi:hypothetical protein
VEHGQSTLIVRCTPETYEIKAIRWIEISGSNHAMVMGLCMFCGVRLVKFLLDCLIVVEMPFSF